MAAATRRSAALTVIQAVTVTVTLALGLARGTHVTEDAVTRVRRDALAVECVTAVATHRLAPRVRELAVR